MKYFSEFIKKLIKSFTHHYKSIYQVPRLVFEIFCWQRENAQIYKVPLLMKYFSEFIQKLIIQLSLPINSPSFKALASTDFEIFCWQGKNAQKYIGP